MKKKKYLIPMLNIFESVAADIITVSVQDEGHGDADFIDFNDFA